MTTPIPKRFQVSDDGGTTWTTVVPDNGANIRLQDSRNIETGQVFARRKLSTDPVFSGVDYQWLLNFERDPFRRCSDLILRLDQKCSGSWREVWRGEFSSGSCEFDLDHCRATVKTKPLDRYSCLLDAYGVKRNILQVEPVDANVVVLPSLEFILCEIIGGIPICGSIDDTGFTAVHAFIPIVGGPNLAVLWREVGVTECINGNPVPPPGAGWTLLEDNCATNGTAKYYRTPLISYTWGDPQFFLDGDGYPEPPPDTCNFLEIGTFDFSLIADPPGIVPFYICLSDGTPTEVNRARVLKDAFEYLIEQTGCTDLAGIRSDFFAWDPVGDAPGYVAGENYVTGTPNQHAHLLIVQKSDAMDPSASNPATIGETTLKDMLAMLLVTHQVFWDIDDQGFIRIEHWKYWQSQPGLDAATLSGAIEFLKYKHLGDEIPRIERAQWMEAQNRDFIGRDIIYSGACVGENTQQYDPGQVTTDINFVFADPDAISKQGFVLLATTFNTVVYDTIIDTGAITGTMITNAPLSWANLQRDFWTWNRYLPSGNMNGQDVTFDGFRPNIEQEGLSLPMCCGLSDFDAREYLSTRLGARLGIVRAEVVSADHDIQTGRTTFVLRYAY
jgi:hypothetical protein